MDKNALIEKLYNSASDEKPLSQIIDNLRKALRRCPKDLTISALENMNSTALSIEKQTSQLIINDNNGILKIAEFSVNVFTYYNDYFLLNQNPKTAQAIFDYTMAIFRHRHDTKTLMNSILLSKGN